MKNEILIDNLAPEAPTNYSMLVSGGPEEGSNQIPPSPSSESSSVSTSRDSNDLNDTSTPSEFTYPENSSSTSSVNFDSEVSSIGTRGPSPSRI